MSLIFDRTRCHHQADLMERIGSSFIEPFTNAFGNVYIIHGNFDHAIVQTVSKIKRIVSAILYTLFSPLTVPLTMIGWLFIKLSNSHKDATQKIFQSIHPKQQIDSSNTSQHSNLTNLTPPNLNSTNLKPINLNSNPHSSTPNSSTPRIVPFALSTSLFKWPKDLKLLGITSEESKQLEEFLKALQPIMNQSQLPSMQWIKKPTTNEINLFNRTWQLPMKVRILGKEGERRLILNIKTKKAPSALITGQGGNRKIKKCYDPIEGEFIIKKRILNKSETDWIEIFANKTGIVKNIAIQKIFKGNQLEKTLSFEPYYDGSLLNLLHSNTYLSTKDKLEIIKSFLTGIHQIHQTTSVYTMPEGLFFHQNGKEFSKVNFSTFHNDIKPANVLFKVRKTNTYEIGLSDFDIVNLIDQLAGTAGYRSPELLKIWKDGKCRLDNSQWYENSFLSSKTNTTLSKQTLDKSKTIDVITFNLYNGQKRDLWSTGLVISEILLKDFKGYTKSKMKWRDTIEFFGQNDKEFRDGWLINTSEEDIVKEIENIKQQICSDYPRDAATLIPLWDIVRDMLKMHSFKRLSVEEALKIIDKIPA